MSNPLAESALEIWLIQDAITATFTFRDFYNCTRVSKAWNKIFNPSLWRVVVPCYNKLGKDQFLLDPESTLHQQKFYHLVKVLTLTHDGHLPLFHPLQQSPSSPHLSQIKEVAGELPLQRWQRLWVNSPDPALPSLQALTWRPDLNFKPQPPPALELNLLRFLEIHQNSLHNLYLRIHRLDDFIFNRLCSVLEAMPSLRQVTLTAIWIQTSEQVQRFFWACRRLHSSCQPRGDFSTGRTNRAGGSSGGVMDTNAAINLYTYNSKARDKNAETLFAEEKPVWTPLFEPTQIRSMNLNHGVWRKFWIYVPVFKMCPFLERLEIEVPELEGLVPLLRQCLHSSCPQLKVLKIMRGFSMEADNIPLNWSLGLLCPGIDEEREGASQMETFKPTSPLYKGRVPAINRDLVYAMTSPVSSKTHLPSCFGFQLMTFQAQTRGNRDTAMVISSYPRPWHHLLDHHGQTLTNLDLTAIVMPLQEFVNLASAGDQMPHLLSLTASMVWTDDEWKSLSTAILAEKRIQRRRRLLGQQSQGGTSRIHRTIALLDSVGLRPWTACRRLVKLELNIDQSASRVSVPEWNGLSQELVQERVLLEYLVHEICQTNSLEKLIIRTKNIRWPPVLTLPASFMSPPSGIASRVQARGSKEYEEAGTFYDGDIGEDKVWGYLDQFSNLRWLKVVIWMQPENMFFCVQDVEWIMDHWPRLYVLTVRDSYYWGADRSYYDLLKKRTPEERFYTSYGY